MDRRPTIGRRRFIGVTAGGAAGLLPFARSHAALTSDRSEAGIRRYVRLGGTDIEISDISFGSSRLRRGQENLVRHALDRGINYFDTAESYSGGASETVLGRALKGRRDEVFIASKMHVGASTTRGAMMAQLDESLRRLQTDHVDIYFNHAVNEVERLQNPEWFEFVEAAKRQGKFRYTGMSGHAGRLIECLDYALDNDIVDVILASFNFGQDPEFYETLTRSFDFRARQPELPRVLEKARNKNVGVIAMKTLMGARLNDMRPFEREGGTFAEAGLRWTLSNSNVDALIISMTSVEGIDEYLGASGATRLAAGDLPLLQRYAKQNGATYCRHACNDCSGACPYGVPIADVLRTRMYATDYRDVDFAQREYRALQVDASACVGCSGEPCRDACTHGIDIAGFCAPTHRMLA